MGNISAYESLFAELSAEAVLTAELSSPGTITGSISVSPQRPYVDLPELTNPATAAEIVLGYQAIDKNSYRLTGTLDLDALKEESYSEGYETGKADGYSEGYEAGKTDGYSEGYEAGRTDGYNEGYTDGVASADAQSYYDSGYADAENEIMAVLATLTDLDEGVIELASYLSALIRDRDLLAVNLQKMGVDADASETFTTLVAKVLKIPIGTVWTGLAVADGVKIGAYELPATVWTGLAVADGVLIGTYEVEEESE